MRRAAPGSGASTAWIVVALVAGAAVRLALLRHPRLWPDESNIGTMGLAVLRGELPIFFYGQPFMGALDAYLVAPLYVALGVSARTLELLPVLLAILWLALLVRLAWDGLGPRAALFTAIVLAVPPDYLLFWSHEARTPYPLSLALGTLALLLARRIPHASARPARLLAALLGVVLGLGFWTNLLVVVFFPAVAVLLLQRGLRPLLPAALPGLGAFFVGSLPHWAYGLVHGTAIPSAGSPVGPAEMAANLQSLARVSWPLFAGVPASLRGTAAGAALAFAFAAAAVLAVLAAARAIRRGAPGAAALHVALLGLLATNLALALGSPFGRVLALDPRYLLPSYAALAVLAGHGLAAVPARAAWTVAAALLLVQGAGAAEGSFRLAAAERWELLAMQADLDLLRRQGLWRLYMPHPAPRALTFLSREEVIASHYYQEAYPPYALAVDGAGDAGWWVDGPSADFEANLAALGVGFTYHPLPWGGLYAGFTVAAPGLGELDPARFRVRASESPSVAAWIADRDAATIWRTGRPKQGGEWLEVDLGTLAPVALVRWLPGSYQEMPEGLRLEASGDGATWQRLVELPRYHGLYWSAGRPMGRVRSGRVELRVPPTPARFLRVTQLGASPTWRWSVRELFVYAAASAAVASPRAEGRRLAAEVAAAGVSHLYADHGWGSRVALADPAIRILPANVALDAYGAGGATARALPDFHWRPGGGVLLEPLDAPGFEAVARESGLGIRRRVVGDLVLFTHAPPPPLPGRPLAAGALAVTASLRPGDAARMLDGDPRTRWGTGRPQAPGDWLRIDLATRRVVRALRVWTASASDSPRGLALEASEDGREWRPVAARRRTEGRLQWGGVALLRDRVQGLRLDFEPLAVRALRVVLTAGDPVFDWSVHELAVYEDAGPPPAG